MYEAKAYRRKRWYNMLTKVGFYIFQTGRIETHVECGDREVPEAPGDQELEGVLQLKAVIRCIPCPCEEIRTGGSITAARAQNKYSFCLDLESHTLLMQKPGVRVGGILAETSLPSSALDLSRPRSKAAAGTRNIKIFVGNTSVRMFRARLPGLQLALHITMQNALATWQAR
jgi:hypothetical protein